MKTFLRLPAVQIAVAVALYLLVGLQFGPFGFVFASPLLAIAVAVPIQHLVADIRHKMREDLWLPEHGHYFNFKGHTIRVMEDESHARWVCLADVRKVMPLQTTEHALALMFKERYQETGTPAHGYLRDDALVEHLARSQNDMTLRFRTWVERTVAMPGAKVRERLGIRLDGD
jgi:hypothetical protein